jgi:uncharacterized membrane protein YbaN (DUF454 family)
MENKRKEDKQIKTSSFKRGLYTGLGFLNIGLGILGIILPVFPTTVWLLLAAWCFSKGNPHFKNKLLNHKILGSYVKAFYEGQGLTRKQKFKIVFSITFCMSISAYFFQNDIVYIALTSTWAGLMLFFYCYPTAKSNNQETIITS